MYKKDRQPTEEWAKDLNRHHTKEEAHRANKYMKRCPTPLVPRETKIKITKRYHYILTRKKKACDTTVCWHGCAATGTLVIAG